MITTSTPISGTRQNADHGYKEIDTAPAAPYGVKRKTTTAHALVYLMKRKAPPNWVANVALK